MKLYDTQIAPNPRRVRIFLAEKDISVPTVQINILEKENLGEEFLKINPRGLIPTLQLDDGTVIDESVAICRYFEEIQPEPSLMGWDAVSSARIESWQRRVEFDGFMAVADAFRNSIPLFANRAVAGTGVEFKAIPELAERGRQRLALFYEKLNHRLAANEFIAGERFSIADITGLCAVDFAAGRVMDVPQEHENIRRWYAAVSSRPSASA